MRAILHVDMDAFYASVEQRDDPTLIGKPVIVGGAEGRGVVSACSYEARRFGVRSAMPGATARRLCPSGIFLPVRMGRYAEVSKQIRTIFDRFTPLVEPLSLDEAFLDVTASEPLFGPAVSIGLQIKAAIKTELRLVASVGVAPNKFLAKLASDLEKPDGFVVVEAERLTEFLDPLPIERMWGVGKVTRGSFDRINVRTIADLRKLDLKTLEANFGNSAQHFFELARGIDDRPVISDRDTKSISHAKQLFREDVADRETLLATLLELTEQLGYRMRNHGTRGRTVRLKLRYGDFRTVTRAQTLTEATDATQVIWETVKDLFATAYRDESRPVRLLGVGVAGVDETGEHQGLLFDESTAPNLRRVDEVADEIRSKFGKDAIGRAATLEPGGKSGVQGIEKTAELFWRQIAVMRQDPTHVRAAFLQQVNGTVARGTFVDKNPLAIG